MRAHEFRWVRHSRSHFALLPRALPRGPRERAARAMRPQPNDTVAAQLRGVAGLLDEAAGRLRDIAAALSGEPLRGTSGGAAESELEPSASDADVLSDAVAENSAAAARVPADRLMRARIAGEAAGAVLRGERARVPATPPLTGAAAVRRVFVILRGERDEISGYTVGGFESARRFVEARRGVLADEALFHGFASLAEAAAYWDGAGMPRPWRRLSQEAAA